MPSSSSSSPRLKDIAALCGVSTATVSRALRDPKRHSKELTERIKKATKTLGYDPEVFHGARKLSMRRHGKEVLNQLVGLVLPKNFQKSPYFMKACQGILDVLSEADFGVVMLLSSMSTAPSCLLRGDIDGLISFPRHPEVLDLIPKSQAFPDKRQLYILDYSPGHINVIPDYIGGMCQCVRHLIELGHRRFALIHRKDVPIEGVGKSEYIYQGVRKAIVEAGLDPKTSIVGVPIPMAAWDLSHNVMAMSTPEDHQQWLRCVEEPSLLLDMVKSDPQLTAVLGSNDALATYAWLHLERHGVSVPDRVSVAGFDDLNPFAPLLGLRRVTTARVELEEIGRRAAQLMLDVLNGNVQNPKEILHPAPLIVGDSTAKVFRP